MRFLPALALAISLTVPAAAQDLRIVTGGEGGTYEAVGAALAAQVTKDGTEMTWRRSSGSLSNLLILSLDQAELGLCQFDVFMAATKGAAGGDLRQDLRVVSPLFLEEIHLLLRNETNIDNFRGLAGHAIGVGPLNSGTHYTAQRLLRSYGLGPDRYIADHSNSADAIRKLQSGDIDAAFIVGGQPLGMLAKAEGIKLVGLSKPKQRVGSKSKTKALGGYQYVSIPAGTYPFQKSAVRTLATPCLLVGRAGLSTELVRQTLKSMFQHKAELTKLHSKWKDLDRGACARIVGRSRLLLHRASRAFFLGGKVTPGALVLASGSKGGSYLSIASSIRAAASRESLGISVVSSPGSAQNLMAVAHGQADLGMTQLDVLLHMGLRFPKMLSSIRVALPLYREEILVLVRKDAKLKTLADLEGKRVGVGLLGSGTSITASLLLKFHGLVPRIDVETVDESSAESLSALRKGQLDAVFVVGGAPVAALSALPAEAAKELQILPLDEHTLAPASREFSQLGLRLPYEVTTLPAKSYPWLTKPVKVLSTPCLLVSSSRASDERIGAVIDAVVANGDVFEHPKLGGFDLARAKELLATVKGRVPGHTALLERLGDPKAAPQSAPEPTVTAPPALSSKPAKVAPKAPAKKKLAQPKKKLAPPKKKLALPKKKLALPKKKLAPPKKQAKRKL